MLKTMLCGIALLTLIACLAGCEFNEFFGDVLSDEGDEDGGILPDPPGDQGADMPDDPGVTIDPDGETVSTENPDVMEVSEQ